MCISPYVVIHLPPLPKTSANLCYSTLLKFEVLKVSRLGWERAQSALCCSRQASNLEADSVKIVIWKMPEMQEGKVFTLLGVLP